MIRLDAAQRNVARLEQAIQATRDECHDWPEDVLATHLAPLVRELDNVRASIERELRLAEVREGPEFVWFTMNGGRIGKGRAPVKVVSDVLEAVQKGVRQLAAFIETGVAATARLPSHLADEAELDLFVFASGSAKLGLAPAVPQQRVEFGGSLADLAVAHLVRTLVWAQQEGYEAEIEEILPDPTVRRQLMSRVREIAPSGRSLYETVEVSGYGVAQIAGDWRFEVTPRAFERASAYLRSRDREQVTYIGQLVAIDVEKDVFDLRHGQYRIHCHFPDEVLEAAKRLIEAYVEVAGEGRFRLDSDVAYRVDVEAVRRLAPEEHARE